MDDPGKVSGLDDIAALERVLAELRETAALVGGRARRSNYDLARTMYRERREREAIFGGLELFGEPAWDMLLHLYIMQAEGERVSVSSACVAAIVPATTALRWIDSLMRRGFVDRASDETDRRRAFLRLSDKGIKTLEVFFQSRAELQVVKLGGDPHDL